MVEEDGVEGRGKQHVSAACSCYSAKRRQAFRYKAQSLGKDKVKKMQDNYRSMLLNM